MGKPEYDWILFVGPFVILILCAWMKTGGPKRCSSCRAYLDHSIGCPHDRYTRPDDPSDFP